MAQTQTTQFSVRKNILDRFDAYENACVKNGIRSSRSMQIREAILSYKEKNDYIDLLLPIEQLWLERLIYQGDLKFEKSTKSPTHYSSYTSSPETDEIIENMVEELEIPKSKIYDLLFKRYFISLEIYAYFKSIIDTYYNDHDIYMISCYASKAVDFKAPSMVEDFLENLKGLEVHKKVSALSPCGIRATIDAYVFKRPILS